MLNSAFARESESVYVDLLTYNDLELLKARKLGNGTSLAANTSSSSMSRSHMKRYVILTYSGEFDRVHFPLPLVYEESPNVKALQRTIRRLRKQAQQHEAVLAAPSSSRERCESHILSIAPIC
jgi:coiled-coil domain-containing protein 61